ncbi:Monooxygenase, FAD-binding protein [Niveomyces insectorum RCEF 264]|uniref:Monooxygenase, FAD-binding protein n=1 Tax=Niveomyces insectorum RCEF 264 TaxID=1081102 RepID=A0A162KBX0_9HYPO|nr:Monooxygenase, FAD-binding protein [Niveomyces insectorum RCEF 264]
MQPQSHVDVLIVGAGPAGMMMAAWMARCGIKTRIVDKRGTKVFNGQADGLQCRTLEIFDSFGIANRAWIESNHMLEVAFWNPDETGQISRSGRIPDTIPNISRFQQVVLHQGRIERFFLDLIERESPIRVERGVLPTELHLDEALAEDSDAYPITVTLRHLSEDEATPKQVATSSNGIATQDGLFRSNLAPDDTADLLRVAALEDKANTTEVVKAKYLVGADGAHSWVRSQLGFSLEGESTDYIWGVLDIVPITDFPDIRMRCAIHSADSGSIMVIPRENKLVRLYIQITTTEKLGEASSRADRSKITPEVILKSAQKIMAPYTLTYRKLDWWTAYQIGQRVGTHFAAKERIFLAGDAVHTHSPKAGQGMNVSMQDRWKIANVVKGLSSRSILKTYEEERSRIAHDLIKFDHRFSRLFSGRPAKDVMDEEGVSPAEFKEAFEKGNMFASGIAVDYGPSVIVAKPLETALDNVAATNGDADSKASVTNTAVQSRQELATLVKIGMRMPSFKVLSQADARPWHFQERLASNGTWRVVFFVGDLARPDRRGDMLAMGEALSQPQSFRRRFTPTGWRYDSVIELLTVHASPRTDYTIFDFPEVFRPFDEIDGWDYNKIFVDDQSYHEGHGHAYEHYGINPAKGAIVILRPDQYVAYVGAMDDYQSLDSFFSGFMISQTV